MANIYSKILELQKAVRGLGKDARGNGYQYVSGGKLLSFVRPKMDEIGILLKQEVVSLDCHREDYTTKNGQKSEMFTTVRMRFTWVDTDTGETDVNEFAANGMNGWDKGLGSALTYGERYFLLKYFHIPTDEDDVDAIIRDDRQIDNAPDGLSTAINDVYGVSSEEELTDVWNRYKGIFGKNTEFKKAVANSPYNPNKKKKR